MKSLSSAHAHAEPGLDRRAIGRDVVAVQRVANLQAQACRGRRGHTARCLGSRIASHRANRVLRRAAELAAALARVARAGDEAVDAEHVHVLAEGERLDLDLQPLERLRSLNREVRPVVGDVLGLGERAVIVRDVGGVDDQQKVVVTPAVDDQVVDDPAARRW